MPTLDILKLYRFHFINLKSKFNNNDFQNMSIDFCTVKKNTT